MKIEMITPEPVPHTVILTLTYDEALLLYRSIDPRGGGIMEHEYDTVRKLERELGDAL